MTIEEIQKDGANARALGRNIFENPYMRSEQMPAVTGESLESWQVKYGAWEFGWKMEDLMRPPRGLG